MTAASPDPPVPAERTWSAPPPPTSLPAQDLPGPSTPAAAPMGASRPVPETPVEEDPDGPYPPPVENPKSNCQFNQLDLVRVNDNNIHPILVLSSRQLTLEEHEVLLLGLKFAPTPRRVPDPLEYFDRYHEQCRRTYNKLTHVRADRPLPKLIEEHLVVIKDKLSHLAVIGKKDNQAQTHEQWNNLSTKHQQAIRRLRLDKSLTIKPADKGSCIVVMDTKDYLSEGLKELADKSTYMELESDPTAEITDASNAILDKYHGIGMINKYTRDKYFTSIDDVRTQYSEDFLSLFLLQYNIYITYYKYNYFIIYLFAS